MFLSIHVTGTPPAEPGHEPSAEVNVISSDYFNVLRMPILRGRSFGPDDRPDNTVGFDNFKTAEEQKAGAEAQRKPKRSRSVIIDDNLANKFFAGRETRSASISMTTRRTTKRRRP